MEGRGHYRGGLVWPVILIGAGVLFLLNNMGVLSWGIWESLFRLWPVLLIAIGLDILIGRRSLLGSLVVVLLLVAALGAAIWLGVPQGSAWKLSRVDAVDHTETISEALQGAQRAKVEIGFGTGSLRLGALPEGSGELLKGTADLSRNERLDLDHSGSGGQGRLRLRSQNAWTVGPGAMRAENKVWDLELNRDLPLSLDIETGVGRSTLDLARLNLTDLNIQGGVGEVSITLPRRGRLQAKVDGGIGDMTLTIPQGMAARIRVDGGLGSTSLDGEFDRRDREYTSPDYSTAENRVDLDVNGGIGRIIIRAAAE